MFDEKKERLGAHSDSGGGNEEAGASFTYKISLQVPVGPPARVSYRCQPAMISSKTAGGQNYFSRAIFLLDH